MPEWFEAGCTQTANRTLSQIPILKTTAGQNDLMLAHSRSHQDDRLDEGVMRLCGDPSSRLTGAQVAQNASHHCLPVDNSRSIAVLHANRIRLVRGEAVHGKFKGHRGLALKAGH